MKEAVNFEKNDQQYLLVNMDKKKIMEPARLTCAGNRIGIEPIDTDTFERDVYFEMFPVLVDKSVCQLGVEYFYRRYGGLD